MYRRDFLQTTSIAFAGFYLCGFSADLFKKKSLGLQLYSVRDAVAKNLESTLEKLAKIGYNGLEIYGYDGKFFGHSASEFKTILSNTAFKVISSHHSTGRLENEKGSLSNNWQQSVEDVHEIGASFLVCAWLSPPERTTEYYRALPELLEKSGTATKSANIQFAYHNHDFEFEPFDGSTAYDFLLQNTSPELVKMEFDLYWISKSGYDPIAYFNKYPGRFPLWHVKDMAVGTKDFTEIGKGTIDFDRIFAARKKAGLQHWFVEQDESKGDIFESLRISAEFLQHKKY